jgi:hypothetical protein
MDALLQVQYDWNDKLNSEPYFQNIGIAMYRSMVTAQEIARRIPFIVGKNNRNGLGGIVNMPTILGIDPNISTPQSVAVCTLDVIENPELNFLINRTTLAPTGTQTACEEAVRKARAILQPLSLRGVNFFHDDEARVIQPIPDIHQVYPGCCGYRLELKCRLNEPYEPKCTAPTITGSGDTITIATTQAGATTYFTVDGSFPGPSSTGPNGTASTAAIYAAPFAAASGAVISAASYLAGNLGSDVSSFIAP